MKRQTVLIAVFCFLVAFLFSGCAKSVVDFTIISTKNIDLSRVADFKRAASRIEGEDKVFMIVIIPTGNPNMQTAIDKAIQSVPGAVALLDGVVTFRSFYIPYVYGESSYVVEGTPLIDPKLIGELPTNHIFCALDTSNNVREIRYLSKVQYVSLKKEMKL